MSWKDLMKRIKPATPAPRKPNYKDLVQQALSRIERTQQQHSLILSALNRGVTKLMSDLSDAIDAAEAAATADADANNAAANLLTQLNDMLKAAIANGTPAEQVARVRAFTEALNQRSADLASAVVANTPAAA